MRRTLAAVHAAWTRSDALLYLLTFVLCALTAWFALDLGTARLDAPFEYAGDALAVGAHVKTTLETGWYEHQAMLGAPYGQTYHDFPQADNLHLVVVKLIGLFTQDWAVALNVYYLIGFPLAALSAVWFFRTVGVGRLLSAALAVAFAFAPYHFMRGEGHLWLASYYGVPLAMGLLVLVLQGRPLWGRGDHANPVLAWLLSPAARTIVFIAVLAMSGSYYGVFFLVLLAAAGIAVLIRDRSWKRFWGAVMAGVTTVLVMLANMLPDVIYGWVNGRNSGGLERLAPESEIYALKLTQLLMPWPHHRIPILSQIRAAYDNQYPLVSERPALGVLGALGLVAAFLVLAYLAFGWRDLSRRAESARTLLERVGWLAGLLFVAFLFSTVGGLSTLISFATDALRGWNRMSIIILLFALGVVGLLLGAALRASARRFSWRTTGRVVASATVAGLLVAVAFVDQTPGDLTASRAAAAEAYDADAAWIDQVAGAVPEGAMILQIPYVPFPESSSATGVLGSESLVPYLHSGDLRWSGGGIKGRPRSDYPQGLQQFPGEDLARLAAIAGFDGILIDRNAMPDRSEPTENGLAAALDAAPLVSQSGRYAFFALTDADALRGPVTDEEREHLAALLTNPVTVYRGPGFTAATGADGYPEYTTVLEESTLHLVNPGDEDVAITLELSAMSDEESVSSVRVLGAEAALPSSPEPASSPIRLSVTVPPGTHDIVVENGTGGRLTIANPRAVADDVTAYLAESPVGG